MQRKFHLLNSQIVGFLVGIALLLAMESYERKRLWKQVNREY